MRRACHALRHRTIHQAVGCAMAGLLLTTAIAAPSRAARDGTLRLHVADQQTKSPLAARLHLKNARGVPVRVRAKGALPYRDHVVFVGEIELNLRVGQYHFTLDAGPEYKPRAGHFTIEDHADDDEVVELPRFVDLAKEGWWSGDLSCLRLQRHAPMLMRAEDLRMLPILVPMTRHTKSPLFNQHFSVLEKTAPKRLVGVQSMWIEDGGGALAIHNVSDVDVAKLREVAADTTAALQLAREHGWHVDVAYAASWDLPIWIATGAVDSIQMIDSASLLDGIRSLPTGCRRPDKSFFPGNTGQGRWAERIYFHLLNCGLRIAPSAGSGSGLTRNPPGANRVYAQCGQQFDAATWWSQLRAGNSFVTNGPLLRATARGYAPGEVFHLQEGEPIDIQIALQLATRHSVSYLQIIKNGEIEHEVGLRKWAADKGRLPLLHFDRSGWFLIRAATDDNSVYRFAATAPYYVDDGNGPHISKRSARFFLDWLAELKRREKNPTNARRQQFEMATAFWHGIASNATAE